MASEQHEKHTTVTSLHTASQQPLYVVNSRVCFVGPIQDTKHRKDFLEKAVPHPHRLCHKHPSSCLAWTVDRVQVLHCPPGQATQTGNTKTSGQAAKASPPVPPFASELASCNFADTPLFDRWEEVDEARR